MIINNLLISKIRTHFVPIAIAIFFSLISLVVFNLRKLDKEVEQAKSNLVFLQQESSKMDNLLQQHQSSQERIEKLSMLLPADFYDFARIVEDLLARANLSDMKLALNIEDKQETAKGEEENVSSVAIQLILTGRFQNLIAFFNQLEEVPYYAQINSVDINKGEAGNVEANINLSVFVKG